jgi:hypothetical protein
MVTSLGSQRNAHQWVMPVTTPGKWSVASFGVFVLAALAFFAAAASGQQGAEIPLDNLWLGIPLIVALFAVTTSMVTGLVAVLGRHDRSAWVILTASISTLVSLFVAASLTLG